MKARKTLSLHREALADLRSDELSRVAGAATGLPCLIDGENTPKCPVVLSQGGECESFPINQCLISVTC